MVFVIIPLTVVGEVFTIPACTMFCNLVQMLTGMTLIYKAIVFGRKLSKAMEGLASVNNLVNSIMKTIYIAVSFTALLFVTVFADFGLQGTFIGWPMIFWYGIHAGEIGMYYSLLITKRDQAKKKIAPMSMKESRPSSTSPSSANSIKSGGGQQVDRGLECEN